MRLSSTLDMSLERARVDAGSQDIYTIHSCKQTLTITRKREIERKEGARQKERERRNDGYREKLREKLKAECSSGF